MSRYNADHAVHPRGREGHGGADIDFNEIIEVDGAATHESSSSAASCWQARA